MFGIIYKNNGKTDLYKGSAVFKTVEEASKEASILSEMYDAEYKIIDLWAACTNKSSHGGKPSLMPKIHRLLRQNGIVFSLARFAGTEEYGAHGRWGMCRKEDLPKDAEEVVTGYSFKNVFHKLGDGCAVRGNEIYWRW
jgi:hypothetical protein